MLQLPTKCTTWLPICHCSHRTEGPSQSDPGREAVPFAAACRCCPAWLPSSRASVVAVAHQRRPAHRRPPQSRPARALPTYVRQSGDELLVIHCLHVFTSSPFTSENIMACHPCKQRCTVHVCNGIARDDKQCRCTHHSPAARWLHSSCCFGVLLRRFSGFLGQCLCCTLGCLLIPLLSQTRLLPCACTCR